MQRKNTSLYSNGYTLLELLLCLAILAMLASIAVLSIPHSPNKAASTAKILQQSLKHARDFSLFSGQKTSLRFENHTLHFERHDSEKQALSPLSDALPLAGINSCIGDMDTGKCQSFTSHRQHKTVISFHQGMPSHALKIHLFEENNSKEHQLVEIDPIGRVALLTQSSER